MPIRGHSNRHGRTGGFFIWIKLPGGTKIDHLNAAAVKSGIESTWGLAFFAKGAGEKCVRPAHSWKPPEPNYEGAKRVAQVIKNAP